jgi:hypothetical protein
MSAYPRISTPFLLFANPSAPLDVFLSDSSLTAGAFVLEKVRSTASVTFDALYNRGVAPPRDPRATDKTD